MQRIRPIEKQKIFSNVTVSYSGDTMNDDVTNTILFLGVGQTGNNLKVISTHVPRSVLIIGAIPYHKIPREHFDDVCVKLFDALTKKLKPLHVIAESQAAPMAILAAELYPERVRSITLLEPLGFNKSSLGSSDEERYRQFVQRSRQFWRQPNQTMRHVGNRKTLIQVLAHSLPAWKRLKPDYIYGVSRDVVDSTRKLAETIPVTIYAGEHDSIFPYHEILPNLANSKVNIIEVKNGTHLNRATSRGLAELDTVIRLLKS